VIDLDSKAIEGIRMIVNS